MSEPTAYRDPGPTGTTDNTRKLDQEQVIARVHERNERGDPIVILVDDRAFIAATHLRLRNSKAK
jgi:hypothetical protein